MLGRWKSLSTHRGWRGNRGRGEIFDRKPADRSVHKESQYFYFNTSGINILAFVVWHLVSRGRENFCPSERNGLRHRGGAIRGQQFHRLNGRKGLTRREGGHPSSSRDIFVDLMDRPGDDQRRVTRIFHGNTTFREMTAFFRFDPSNSISRGLTLNASTDHETRFDDSLWGRDLSLDPFSRLEITLSENKLLNYLFGTICVDRSLFDKV